MKFQILDNFVMILLLSIKINLKMLNQDVIYRINDLLELHSLSPISVLLSYNAFHYDEEDGNDYFSVEEIKIGFNDLIAILNDDGLSGYLKFSHPDNQIYNVVSSRLPFFQLFDGIIYCDNGMITINRVYKDSQYLFPQISYHRYDNAYTDQQDYSSLKKFVSQMAENADEQSEYYHPIEEDDEVLEDVLTPIKPLFDKKLSITERLAALKKMKKHR